LMKIHFCRLSRSTVQCQNLPCIIFFFLLMLAKSPWMSFWLHKLFSNEVTSTVSFLKFAKYLPTVQYFCICLLPKQERNCYRYSLELSHENLTRPSGIRL
jgi:hypothetical protein